VRDFYNPRRTFSSARFKIADKRLFFLFVDQLGKFALREAQSLTFGFKPICKISFNNTIVLLKSITLVLT